VCRRMDNESYSRHSITVVIYMLPSHSTVKEPTRGRSWRAENHKTMR